MIEMGASILVVSFLLFVVADSRVLPGALTSTM
jgi:hypothetical protein